MLQFVCGKPETNSSMLQHLTIERCSYISDNDGLARFSMKHSTPSPSTVFLASMSLDAVAISWEKVTHVELCSFDPICFLALFRSVQAMSHLTSRSFLLRTGPLQSKSSNTHLSGLSRFAILTSTRFLHNSLKLPSLEEIFVDEDCSSSLINLITRSGCALRHLTVMMDPEMPHQTENELIRLLEHTPSLVALTLETPPVTDHFFRRLEPAPDGSVSNDTSVQEFLPLLHTLIIHVFIDFEWHSVAHIFSPSAGSPNSPRRALKVFELKIYGDGKDSTSLHDLKSFVIDDDSMKRLLALRDGGVYATILGYQDREVLANKKNDVHSNSTFLGTG